MSATTTSAATASAPSERFSLKGKTAIVTGASRGIGEAIARAYAAAGANVAIAARKPDALERVAADIRATGGNCLAIATHMGQEDAVKALVARVASEFGTVDILVNNAATNPYFGPMLDIDMAMWDKTFEVNAKGYFVATREVARHLIDRNAKGAIINIASVAGLKGMPMQGVYAMTKAAVISMTKTLAMELGPSGVRVNAIAPGLIETKFASAITQDPTLRQMVVEKTPAGRIGDPDDIAGVALFLASDASSYVTGETIVVDGGWTVG